MSAPLSPMSRQEAERAVLAIYRTVLMREPDPGGFRDWCAALAEGRTSLEQMLAATLRSEEFAQRSAAFMLHYVRRDRASFTDDVSQHGEFPLLLRRMVNAAARHRLVVDVGARGRERSNSYDLLRHLGWRGLLIEPNPHLAEAIRQDFAGLDFALESCAISDRAGTATFFIGANDDVSSLDQGLAAQWGGIRERVEVRVERLETVLRAHGVPHDFDLLSVDAEGQDIAILDDLARTEYAPGWVLFEASHPDPDATLDQLGVSPAVAARYAIAGRTRSNVLLRRVAAPQVAGT